MAVTVLVVEWCLLFGVLHIFRKQESSNASCFQLRGSPVKSNQNLSFYRSQPIRLYFKLRERVVRPFVL